MRPRSRCAAGFDHSAGASGGLLGRQKNGPEQALGRSRRGLNTKIHAATIDENCAVALHLPAGQAHDGRQSESLYPENVLESAALSALSISRPAS